MTKLTEKKRAQLTSLVNEILDGTSYGTLRELAYQLDTLVLNGIPVAEFTNVIGDVTRGPARD